MADGPADSTIADAAVAGTKPPTPHPETAAGPGERQSRFILGMRVDAPTFEGAAAQIMEWAAEGLPRVICAANVHMTMEAHDDPPFQRLVNDADLVLPDGVPTVWGLRLLGSSAAARVRVSPDFLLYLFAYAERLGLRLGLYGGTPETLRAFEDFIAREFPMLPIAVSISPPFRPLTPEEDDEVVRQIRESGAQLLLVGIGCPKQERWMAEHRERLDCVMFGVGAAFDLFGGKTRDAPLFLQRIGMEWVYRTLLEPRRLWRRQAKHNPRFVVLFARQYLASRLLR